MSVLIELHGIQKRFGPINALRETNLRIIQGKITTLLGPNGSGKTTLLRILAGLDSPTKGTITYKGKTITDNNRDFLRRKATLVFQTSVFFNTTVYKNIAYGLNLENYSKEEIGNQIGEVLELVRLQGYEKRRTTKLSGGEQQRVSLARALVLNRELLLLDEPTGNIDPKNVSIIEEAILRVNRERNTSIVLATHNMFQAEALSGRTALLLEGTVRQVGTHQEIFSKSNKYLASFSRLENVFAGISKINQDGTSIIDVNRNLTIEASFSTSGDITVYVRPEDILVSTQPLKSSARNVFSGKIVRITDLGPIARLIVDAGKKFNVQITKKSLIEMNLAVNSEVYITFKASSVHPV